MPELAAMLCFFFFNDTATTEIYTLSLHDALPIFGHHQVDEVVHADVTGARRIRLGENVLRDGVAELLRLFEVMGGQRSEEHTSELQSRQYLVCRLLLEKKNNMKLICSS